MRPRYEVRRFEALPGLILVSAHHDGHASVPHAHAEVSLGFCPDGLDEFRCGSFHGPVAAGSFLAVEGGQIHSDRTKAGPILMVYAPESLVGGPLVFDRPVVHDPGLEGAFHALFRPGPPAWDEFQALWLSRPWVKPGRRPASRFAPLLENLTGEAWVRWPPKRAWAPAHFSGSFEKRWGAPPTSTPDKRAWPKRPGACSRVPPRPTRRWTTSSSTRATSTATSGRSTPCPRESSAGAIPYNPDGPRRGYPSVTGPFRQGNHNSGMTQSHPPQDPSRGAAAERSESHPKPGRRRSSFWRSRRGATPGSVLEVR